jgi:hypothetical protein
MTGRLHRRLLQPRIGSEGAVWRRGRTDPSY